MAKKYTSSNQEVVKSASLVINQLMDDQGVSKSEMADRLGVTKSYVSQTLNNTNTSSLTMMETFANALDYTLIAPQPLPISRDTGGGRLKPKKGKKSD